MTALAPADPISKAVSRGLQIKNGGTGPIGLEGPISKSGCGQINSLGSDEFIRLYHSKLELVEQRRAEHMSMG